MSLKERGENMPKTYSVWVGGVEVNDSFLNILEANKLLSIYLDDEYKDVQIRKEK